MRPGSAGKTSSQWTPPPARSLRTISDAKQAEARHKAGVAKGGTSIEDPLGVRQGAVGQMYVAYLRDPAGHKLCALYRMRAALNYRRSKTENGRRFRAALARSAGYGS